MLNFLDIKFEMTINCWQAARVNRKPKHQHGLLMLHNLPPLTPSSGVTSDLTNERPGLTRPDQSEARDPWRVCVNTSVP